MQGRRNSIISGEATSNIAIFLHFFPKKLVCQPLISGEAGASPASPVPTPLKILKKNSSNVITKVSFFSKIIVGTWVQMDSCLKIRSLFFCGKPLELMSWVLTDKTDFNQFHVIFLEKIQTKISWILISPALLAWTMDILKLFFLTHFVG